MTKGNDQSTRPADTNDCSVCRQLRLDGPDEREYCVAPADGGGWHVWSGALLRFLARMGSQPTQAVIISQPLLNDRYVQVLIGHGIAHAEASSNVYLEDESRLSPEQEGLLAELGWVAPVAGEDDPDEMPANWSLPLIHGDWGYLVEMLVATLAGVFGSSEHLPIEVRSFGCDSPCRDCSWPDDESSETR